VPGVHGRANRCPIGVSERHEDVGIVMAGGSESTFGVVEHPSECGSGSNRGGARGVIDHTVLGEEADDLVIEPVIDVVRIAMNQIDDLILVDELTNRSGQVALHQSS
jgi:hypothetical protein